MEIAGNRFSLPSANFPLRISVEGDPQLPDYFVFDCERLFRANEQRTNDIAKASLMDGNQAVPDKPPETSIAKRLGESALGNIGMPCTIEDRRHFESMIQTIGKRITIDELATLIESVDVSN
jgi:hypothetical protein